MKPINYIQGDATSPKAEGTKIIVHICNDIGGWGRGFVLAVSNKWSEPEKSYRAWYQKGDGFQLGSVQLVQVEEDIWVANLIGQRDIVTNSEGDAPIRYEAIDSGFNVIKQKALQMNASLHMPRIGCGLAGGKWENIEPILIKHLVENDIDTYVYDFK